MRARRTTGHIDTNSFVVLSCVAASVFVNVRKQNFYAMPVCEAHVRLGIIT